jgi:Putative Flp pilus-assembly TadE/G-like
MRVHRFRHGDSNVDDWRRPVGRRRAQRAQVVVLFAGAIVVLLALCATVVDVAWYWTNNLRMQRAADAAALAGVVWLPGNVSTAYSTAIAEASRNGYVNGAGGVTVNPVQDTTNPRRLGVTIAGPVGTFFARAVGINDWPAKRVAKADYVLPVPMGSPINYYGVGFFEGRVATTTSNTTSSSGNTGLVTATAAPSGGQWSYNSGGGSIYNAVRANDSYYGYSATNNQQQQWSTFNLTSGSGAVPNPAGNQALLIRGLEVNVTDAYVSASCSNSRFAVEVSWDGGSSWSTAQTTPTLGTNTNNGDYAFGSSSDVSSWGSHTWAYSDFTNANFRVRITAQKGCGGSTQLRLDELQVRVTWRLDTTTTTTTWNTQTMQVNDPQSGSPLTSQGFWGAIFTPGGWRENGDKYAPAHIGNGTGAPGDSASPTYDSNGYDYTLELPGGSGQVRLFDPIFCATGDNGHGGSFGAGDHWTSPGNIAPVGITYRLYNTQGTLLDLTDDGPPVATLTYNPGTHTLGDVSGAFGTPQNSTDPNLQDCSTNPAHNQWVQMANGLASGTYRLNINTSLDAANQNVGAENLFSVWAQSGGSARVYGGGRMAAYTNLDGGLQRFYFAQIEKVHAGKTMLIHLFDPGEAAGNAYLRILSPDGNSYHYQTFDWADDAGRGATGVTSIQTSINGAAQFNNKEITITIPLPADYGASGLNPPGDATDEDGWWQIEYNVNQGNDTTTWSVDIRGNPVHLVLP